jgi:light-regulated signal transduction histidine kinase (bacteriophytochrome)
MKMNEMFVRILLVESSEAIAVQIRTSLEEIGSDGYRLDWVSTPQQAIEAIRCFPYRAYLLDLEFAQNTHEGVLPLLLERREVAPAIALVSDRQEGLAALEWGAADYLEKNRLSGRELERSLRLTLHCSRLQRSNRELEQFASLTSHDLQEPLRAVVSFAELLEAEYRDALDANAREYLDFIIEGTRRMQQLIQDLLALSRVGTWGEEFAPTDCNRVLEQVLGNLSIAIAEKGAVVTGDRLPTVIADESQLIQLFQNLIANGIKFCEEDKPQIQISATAIVSETIEPSKIEPTPLGEWQFCIRDRGIGIDPRDRDRIFTIFQRLHTRTQYEGTGIGLAICQKIVQRHGGRIWVESQLGQGAAFYFTLPLISS